MSYPVFLSHSKWKDFFVERSKLKPVEVKYDAKTETLRSKAKRHLASALGLEVSTSSDSL